MASGFCNVAIHSNVVCGIFGSGGSQLCCRIAQSTQTLPPELHAYAYFNH